MKKKIAVIGLGDICKKAYLPILGADKDIDLMLYNRSPGPLAEVKENYRIDYGTCDFIKLIADQPEAAFVLTSPESHYLIIKKLLENGIDVFVEKPATMCAKETKELAELADRNERILMVGYNRRYAPLHIKAKEIWGEKPVGMGVFRKFRESPTFEDIERQLYDDTIHQIDLLRFYCGEGKVISSTIEAKDSILRSATAVIRLESGGIGVVETNLQAGSWREYYSLYGQHKSVEIEAFSKLLISEDGENREWVEPYSSAWQPTLAGRGFEGQIIHFLTCLETRDQPSTTAWDSVKTQELTETIIEKMA